MSSRSEPNPTEIRRPPVWRRILRRARAASQSISIARSREPPPGFDWRWYVKSYTDLAGAGIADETSAIRHWRKYGCREGRRFAPRRPNGFDWLTYVDRFPEGTALPVRTADGTRPRLVCPSVDSIFLRAWG
ncbi:MAG TPA: hypothetical protein VGS98_12550, partial [Thermoanaerobaculia bacterium]|nr:hypothetical protein [Thermoanaerobaculia bacterium]